MLIVYFRLLHVLIEFKKWMCYIDGQKNKYSVLEYHCKTLFETPCSIASYFD
jgi:hypothetical protein